MKKLYNVVLVSSCFLQLPASHVFGGGNFSKAKPPTTYQIGTQPQNPSTNTTEIPQVMQLTEDELKACTKESLARIILDTTKSNQWDKIACLYIKKISQDEKYENFNLEEICDAMECVEKLKENVSNSSIKNKLENLLPQLEACAGGSARLNTCAQDYTNAFKTNTDSNSNKNFTREKTKYQEIKHQKIEYQKIIYEDYNDYLYRLDVPSKETLFNHYPFFVRELPAEEKRKENLSYIECPCVKKFSLSKSSWLYKKATEEPQARYYLPKGETQVLQCFYFLSLEDNPQIIKIASNQYELNELNAQIKKNAEVEDTINELQTEAKPEDDTTNDQNSHNESSKKANTKNPIVCPLNDKHSILGTPAYNNSLEQQKNYLQITFIYELIKEYKEGSFAETNTPKIISRKFSDYTPQEMSLLKECYSNRLQVSQLFSLEFKPPHAFLTSETTAETQEFPNNENYTSVIAKFEGTCNSIKPQEILKDLPLDNTPQKLLDLRNNFELLTKNRFFITDIKEQNLDLTDCRIAWGDLQQSEERNTTQEDCTTEFFQKNKIFFTIYPQNQGKNQQDYVIFTVLYIFKTNALLQKFLDSKKKIFLTKKTLFMDTRLSECFLTHADLSSKITNFGNQLNQTNGIAISSKIIEDAHKKIEDANDILSTPSNLLKKDNTLNIQELENSTKEALKVIEEGSKKIKALEKGLKTKMGFATQNKNVLELSYENYIKSDEFKDEYESLCSTYEQNRNEEHNLKTIITTEKCYTENTIRATQVLLKTIQENSQNFDDLIKKIKQKKEQEEQEAKAKQAQLEEAAKKEKEKQARLLKEQEEQKRLEEQKRKEEAKRKQREEQEKVKAEQERLAKEKKQKEEEEQRIIAKRQKQLKDFEQQIEKAKNELNTLASDAGISDTCVNDSISTLSTLASKLEVNDQNFDKNLEKAKNLLDTQEKNIKVKIDQIKQQKEQEEQKRLEEEQEKAKAEQARLKEEAKKQQESKTVSSSISTTPATAVQTPTTSSTSSSEQWVTATEIVTYFESIGKKNYSMYLKSDKYDIKNPKTGYKMLDDLIKQQFRK